MPEPIYDLNRPTRLPVNHDFDSRREAALVSSLLIESLKNIGLLNTSYSHPLEHLHLHLNPEAFFAVDGGRLEHDETELMAALRDFACSDAFQKIYLDLIRRLHDEVFDGDFVFERIPVIRCVAPGQLNLQPLRLADGTLMAYHSDLLYSDPSGQCNCWLPFTESKNSASLQLCSLDASLEILREFFSVTFADENTDDNIPDGTRMKFFQFIADNSPVRNATVTSSHALNVSKGITHFFDMRQLHATADNTETSTRISMDFRLVPLDVYALLEARGKDAPNYVGTAMLKGGFYHTLQASRI